MENLLNTLGTEVALWTPKVAGAIAIIGLFYLLSKLVKKSIVKAAERLAIDPHLSNLFARVAGVVVVIFSVVTALGTLGINVSALVAGLGLTGFALGFALKDTISNLLSGVLILLYQPFKIGDTVKIAGYEGAVLTIDLRYTELNSGGNKILIPNAKLFTEPVTVFNALAQQPSVEVKELVSETIANAEKHVEPA